MRVATAAACAALALGCAAVAGPGIARTAAEGGSGTYTATGSTYEFNLLNTGTTPWQYFFLVGPAGTSFVGGATVGEITARCVPGQPDGSTNEIQCGPLAGAGLQPNVHLGFTGTLSTSAACGASFQLDVSANGLGSFTKVGDVMFAGDCSATPPIATPPRAMTLPVVRGIPAVGKTLSVKPPVWSAPPTRVSYQWQLCTAARCAAIRGATGPALRLAAATAGHSLRVVVTATLDGTRVTSVSRKIAVPSPR